MIRFMCLLAACCFVSSSASAGIIVSYVGGTVTAGGLGTIDVMVSSNASSLTPDNLAFVAAHFRISPIGAAQPSGLQFVNPQSDAFVTDPSYVFFGNSTASPPLGVVTSVVNVNDDYVGGDGTPIGVQIPLHSGNGPFLLFRFDLDATLALIGDQYTIQLMNDAGTDFWDDSATSLPFDGSSFNQFTVTAVPEPSSFVLLAGGVALYVKRRRRTSAKARAR